MSVFDGEIDFHSVYMVDYAKKIKPKSPRRHAIDDNCLIVGLERDSLKARDQPRKSPDVLCPINFEYYKNAVKRFKDEEPKLTEMYMSKDIDPVPIDNEIQDLKCTEYLTKYCSRELPFMSVNLMRRARALQTLRLPEDVHIPDTTHTGSYRQPAPEKYKDPPKSQSWKPKFDDSLQSLTTLYRACLRLFTANIISIFCNLALKLEDSLVVPNDSLHRDLRRILRIRTPESSYQACHGLLGRVILDKNPFGKPRKEPKFGHWRTPHYYTYYHL